VKGLHEECVYRLTRGLETLLLNVGGGRGTIVPDGWHTIFAALIEFEDIFLLPSFYRDL
jgi:hypothetical protein